MDEHRAQGLETSKPVGATSHSGSDVHPKNQEGAAADFGFGAALFRGANKSADDAAGFALELRQAWEAGGQTEERAVPRVDAGHERIVCVANLARTAQPVELVLGDSKGRISVELMGRTPFPPVTERPYMITLPSHGFLWFRLEKQEGLPF